MSTGFWIKLQGTEGLLLFLVLFGLFLGFGTRAFLDIFLNLLLLDEESLKLLNAGKDGLLLIEPLLLVSGTFETPFAEEFGLELRFLLVAGTLSLLPFDKLGVETLRLLAIFTAMIL